MRPTGVPSRTSSGWQSRASDAQAGDSYRAHELTVFADNSGGGLGRGGLVGPRLGCFPLTAFVARSCSRVRVKGLGVLGFVLRAGVAVLVSGLRAPWVLPCPRFGWACYHLPSAFLPVRLLRT